MIEDLLPASLAAVESRGPLPSCEDAGQRGEPHPGVFPEEVALVSRAAVKRRCEFLDARRCAHQAMRRLGVPPVPLLIGNRGEPLWPADLVGSITHCEGYRAAVAAFRTDVRSVGIDAEPNLPLPRGVLSNVSSAAERTWTDRMSRRGQGTCWDRLLFCMKESVYKAWYPLTGRWLGFSEAEIEPVDEETGFFRARILTAVPEPLGDEPTEFSLRGAEREGILLAVVVVPEAIS
jgi:4'-phosphopantetheinyl transferase EntD